MAIVIGTVIFLIIGFTVSILSQPSRIQTTDVSITGWPVYNDSDQQIVFQYPQGWSVTRENGGILRISPPDAAATLSDMSDETAIYGVRVMPLNAPYSAFPVNLTEQDIQENLSRINSFFLQKTKINLSDGKSVLFVYNVGHDNSSILAFKAVGSRTLQIELGRYFQEMRSISDMVGYFGIVQSLHSY